MSDQRYARQILAFGEEGQRKLREQVVGVVGLGGTGSHVVQLLSYLGVPHLILVDHDRIEDTNLNRVIGAEPGDIGRLKTEVAARHARAILPQADPIELPLNLRTPQAFALLKRCTTIFDCVDYDGPRLVLTEFAAAYRIPLFDVATEITPAGKGVPFDFGGRVVAAMPGDYCVFCAGQIDPELAKAELESAAIQELRKKHGYGLGGDQPAPSVCSVNGIIANLAVTEFMVSVTGIRKPASLLSYRGMRGVVVRNDTPAKEDCYTCKCICGQGDSAGLERYFIR